MLARILVVEGTLRVKSIWPGTHVPIRKRTDIHASSAAENLLAGRIRTFLKILIILQYIII